MLKFHLFTFSLIIFCTVGVESVFQCPPALEIAPCGCDPDPIDESVALLQCTGLSSQAQLTRFIDALKTNNPNTAKLPVDTFIITKSAPSLTSIDLTPLISCNIMTLSFYNNPYLTTVSKSASGSPDKISVTSMVFVKDTPLSNAEVDNILSYVSISAGPDRVSIDGSLQFTGNTPGQNLIPELFSTYKVKKVEFKNTSIAAIESSAFLRCLGLLDIDLRNNKIQKLGADAFAIDQSNNAEARTLNIYLDNNLLQSEDSSPSIAPGFIPSLRVGGDLRYSVSIQNNQLTTLSEETFKNLLTPSGPVTSLKLKGNLFECDDRMKWIKIDENSQTWEKNVLSGVDCANDPGKNIFTTELVKGKNSASSLFQFNVIHFIIVIFTTFRFTLFN